MFVTDRGAIIDYQYKIYEVVGMVGRFPGGARKLPRRSREIKR